MTKRKSHPSGRKGPHGPEFAPERSRPPGEVKPVVSHTRHGKPVDPYNPAPAKPVEREVTDAGCAGVLIAILVFAVSGFVVTIFHLLT